MTNHEKFFKRKIYLSLAMTAATQKLFGKISVEYHHDIPMTVKNTLDPLSGRTFGKISVEQHHDIEEKTIILWIR